MAGGIWEGYDRGVAANRAQSLGALQQAQAVQGILAQQQQQAIQQEGLRQDVAIRGILGGPENMAVKMEKLSSLGPKGIAAAGSLAQLQTHQGKMAEEARLRELRPRLAAQFTTQAQPEVQGNAPLPGQMGPPEPGLAGVLSPSRPASFDRTGYVQAAATQGLIPTEAALAHLGAEEDRKANREQQAVLARERMTATERENKRAIEARAFEGEQNRLARIAQIQAAIAGRTPAAEPAPLIREGPDGVFERKRDGTWKQVMNPTTGLPLAGKQSDKAVAELETKANGKNNVSLIVSQLKDNYENLAKGGGVVDSKNGVISNAIAATEASGIGQMASRFVGTKNQKERNDVAMARPNLLSAIMKATGMSAKQLDSNVELKLWLATATDPTLDRQSNIDALARIDRMYGTGEIFGADPRAARGTISAPTPQNRRASDRPGSTIKFDAQGNMVTQ